MSPLGRRWLLTLAGCVMGLLVALSAGLLGVQRGAALDRARAQAHREVLRLAAELEQSLRLAQASIAASGREVGSDAEALQRLHRPLVDSLSLPFTWRRLPEGDGLEIGWPAGVWQPGLAREEAGHWVLPLRWRDASAQQDDPAMYEVALSREALLARFASEGLPAGGSMSLFRLEDDGATTVLVRHPLVAAEQGRRLMGHVADAVRQQDSGVFDAQAQIDGVRRIVGYQRLNGGARRLVVVYALPTQGVLAPWNSVLPLAVALTLLVAAAVAYGAWRLDRSLQALRRSELRFRLAASQGQVWEWDFGEGNIQPSHEFFQYLGYPAPPVSQMAQTFMGLLHPEDGPRLREVLLRFFNGERHYRAEFRARDAQGRYRWFDIQGSGQTGADGRVHYMAGTIFEVTDRKELEEAQRQTLKHLDTVANASPALFWTTDAHAQPEWVNRAWLAFTGRELEVECHTPWLDDLHPLDRERCSVIFDTAFAAREPYSMEYRLLRHDGQYRWVLEQGQPRSDADNRFIGYVGSCLDVTELRQAEDTARERGDILERVFGVLQDLLFLVDESETFVFFQGGATHLLHRQPDAFLGRNMADVMPADLVQMMRTAMQRARQHGTQEVQYRLDLPGGQRHFSARLAWLPGARQCLFLVRDITEQQASHQAKERLNDFVFLLFRLSSRFINLPLSQMDEAIDAALGDMGSFVRADRAYLFAFDAQTETVTNTHEWCAPGVESRKARQQHLPIQQFPAEYCGHCHGEKLRVPDVQALSPGPLRDMLAGQGVHSLVTLPLMQGELCLGFVGLESLGEVHDHGSEEITLLELFAQMIVNMQLRVQAAEQMRLMTDQLEQKVEERTRQLNDSVRRLQAVNRELESFNYSASHDLRTPLRGIEGFSSLLLEEHAAQLDEQGREYLRRIQRATLHMSELVSDLLAYSRLQQMTEHVGPIGVAASVQAVLQPFQDEIAAREGQVTVDVPEDLAVRADPQGLAIALRNLIDNALKFTPADEAPRIRIAARFEGARALLTVADQGVGFDMKYHDRIFGMFQRLHRQDQIPGTGIGLALVHKAVERMEGQIRAESAPGQGARFEIDLPAA
ncbi:PAS domain-containing protein [Hydrogenophaga sp. NFH-34]|uniref:PAS domain-containing protein n=1 Tax=Hydrogenophaga sp. NFH-34 TaxID=2744446 RepID=UPI001F2AF402|nr:PAS domain-containing protein [Hydrogenophaga sp. NFH-34]